MAAFRSDEDSWRSLTGDIAASDIVVEFLLHDRAYHGNHMFTGYLSRDSFGCLPAAE